NLPIPTHRPGDFGGNSRVPPDGSRLADDIFARLLDSFFDNAGYWFDVVANPFFDPIALTKDQIPRVLGSIDVGRPVPLGLIATRNLLEIGSNHVVVVR